MNKIALGILLSLVITGLIYSAVEPTSSKTALLVMDAKRVIAERGRESSEANNVIGQVRGHMSTKIDTYNTAHSMGLLLSMLYIYLSTYLWYYSISLSSDLYVVFFIGVAQLVIDLNQVDMPYLSSAILSIIAMLVISQS